MPKETHGIYKLLKHGQLPSIRGKRKVQKCLEDIEASLIKDYGGPENISTAQEIIIRATTKALGVLHLAELYVNEYGPIRKKGNDIELRAILGKNYLSYLNSIRQNLLALKELGSGKPEKVVDLGRYIEETYGKKKSEERHED